MRTWYALSDISSADLVLFVPNPATGEHRIVGHVRPTTSRSLYRTEIVGTTIPRGQRVLLDMAWDEQRMVDGGIIADPVAPRIRTLSVPVRHRDQVIAVLAREFSPEMRDPGELELNYFITFRRLARMISEGTFPFPVDEVEVEEAPRVSDGVMLLDASARVKFASPNAVSTLVRSGGAPEVLGLRLEEAGMRQGVVASSLSARLPQTEEIEMGNDHVVVARCVPFFEGGELSGAMLLMRDITELRRRDRLLLSKDATIAEIHHRVKNNLQTISSLLRLQGRRLNEGEARTAIDESVRRIRSIAVVHEILSQEVAADVHFGEIVRPLVRLVEEGLSSPEHPLNFTVTGDAGDLPTAVATPLAVVLTELLQNAADHAFRGIPGGHASVEIVFENSGSMLDVQVTDNGQGVDRDFAVDDQTGLGLTIVRTLVESDLGGAITIERGSGSAPMVGTIVKLRVPLVRGWGDDDQLTGQLASDEAVTDAEDLLYE